MPFPTVVAQRYVTPLREGGSLPAVVETDGGPFVVKFRGAGQGARALVAELVAGGVAAELGLPLPTVAVVNLPDGFGRAEPDPEIQDILKGSGGPNVGLAFLPRAFAYDPASMADLVDPYLASCVVWFDALVTNIDRTPRNPNLLVVAEPDGSPKLWLIDHGAALYVHHDWPSASPERARSAFAPIRDHVLLPIADDLREADEALAPKLTPDVLRAVVEAVPDALLMDAPPGREAPFATADANRQAYLDLFAERLAGPRAWVEAAVASRQELLETLRTSPARPLGYRR
ncbi:MAG TPA: HipA family kinase [Rubricoccaceae bacterium]